MSFLWKYAQFEQNVPKFAYLRYFWNSTMFCISLTILVFHNINIEDYLGKSSRKITNKSPILPKYIRPLKIALVIFLEPIHKFDFP